MREDVVAAPRPPYLAQFASPQLISGFLDGDLDVAGDPARERFGFASDREYAYWAPRLCGLVCVKMVVDGLRPGLTGSVAEMTSEAVGLGAYPSQDDDGRAIDRGWLYAPLVRLANAYGIQGRVAPVLTEEDLQETIRRNGFGVASVNPRVIRGDLARIPDGQPPGGHLVVVLGFRRVGDEVTGYLVHNPSGRSPDMQSDAFIPVARFRAAFAGRGFVLGG